MPPRILLEVFFGNFSTRLSSGIPLGVSLRIPPGDPPRVLGIPPEILSGVYLEIPAVVPPDFPGILLIFSTGDSNSSIECSSSSSSIESFAAGFSQNSFKNFFRTSF